MGRLRIRTLVLATLLLVGLMAAPPPPMSLAASLHPAAGAPIAVRIADLQVTLELRDGSVLGLITPLYDLDAGLLSAAARAEAWAAEEGFAVAAASVRIVPLRE